MANTKSAKKAALQNEKRRVINLARRTAVKSSIKKVLLSVEQGNAAESEQLLKEVAAQLARARGKGVMHANTASRKLSRLAKKVAQVAAQK
jgi:small subunit ribosomal protein S20